MYHLANGGVEDAIVGSSNFTVRGLGLGNSGNNIELNLIVDVFRKRAAAGLQSGRGFILPNAQEQVHDKTDLELVTWLVIKNLEA